MLIRDLIMLKNIKEMVGLDSERLSNVSSDTSAYNLHISNLKNYFSYTSKIGNWKSHSIGNNLIIFNGTKDSLFNFIFCHNNVTEAEVLLILKYLTEQDSGATWAVDPSMTKLQFFLKKHGVRSASKPKKAQLNMGNYQFQKQNLSLDKDVVLIRVDNQERLDMLDSFTSKIFYHRRDIVLQFLNGLANPEIKQDNLQFFLVKWKDQYVGNCGFYLENKTAGFYADGIFPEYRNKGLGGQTILHRLKLLEATNCETVIAHCMSASVNVYKRQGFMMLGCLNLFVSEPDQKWVTVAT